MINAGMPVNEITDKNGTKILSEIFKAFYTYNWNNRINLPFQSQQHITHELLLMNTSSDQIFTLKT